ncbi:MAG: thiamine pyrophosphate-binding protein [Treponema sp.]|jgi:acetolactate synthase-1/2/3 large subunit|nr:thiamine pyrophosphate-binding protein [Treponema sp.]
MTVSEYIIDYIIRRGIRDVFCYPGSTLGFFLEALRKRRGEIAAHLNYHEQASAYAACGYSLASEKPAVCLVMQGPGVTNAASGIADAWLDSIPVIFIAAQVHTSQFKGESRIRQIGVQELDAVAIVKPITKYAKTVLDADDAPYEMERAWQTAVSGRKGPVLLDIPVDVSRTEITERGVERAKEAAVLRRYYDRFDAGLIERAAGEVVAAINGAAKPLVVAGAGIRQAGAVEEFRKFIDAAKAPFVTSLPAQDLYTESPYYEGFAGSLAGGGAEEITNRADVVVAMGSRLSNRTIAEGSRGFAPNAEIVRVDIDEDELTRKVKEGERHVVCDVRLLLARLGAEKGGYNDFGGWRNVCEDIRLTQKSEAGSKIARPVADFLGKLPREAVCTCGRGRSKALLARALELRERARANRVLFTAGLGAMGFAFPAAIGAYYATGKPVYCITGDGCMQMNIQELNYIAHQAIPVTVVLLNNHRLGQIAMFQDRNFSSRYFVSTEDSGYHAPDYKAIAGAYGVKYSRDLHENGGEPEIIEVEFDW